jgi:hypothetical protein
VAEDFKWFRKTIVATGQHLATWVDGYPISSWKDPRTPNANPRKGFRSDPGTIIIQGHDPTTDLLFADIKALELPPSEVH